MKKKEKKKYFMSELKKKFPCPAKKNFFYIKIRPNAPKNSYIETLEDGTIKLAIKAVPENGKANKELIKYLAKELGIGKEYISIVSGQTTRNKYVKIEGEFG